MSRFVVLSFAFLGWSFYELSGGADFEPVKAAKAEGPTPVVSQSSAQAAPQLRKLEAMAQIRPDAVDAPQGSEDPVNEIQLASLQSGPALTRLEPTEAALRYLPGPESGPAAEAPRDTPRPVAEQIEGIGEVRVIQASAPATQPQPAAASQDVVRTVAGGAKMISVPGSAATSEDGARVITSAASTNVEQAEEEAAAADRRRVTGNVVNMRAGPSTKYDVLDQLRRGDEVEVLRDPGNGWVKLRVRSTQRIGWMYEGLLTTSG